ncbi:hypothetical protein [Pleionea sp. CnH1-48]|uniref:hypothetical protein n=1 Tax=Pleionea sp. CnH1-48 TaxID=2954494 RepID=UPI002097B27F|nr:hypothetical protein [Pleionea sp. CnH1-48]MCO7226744.1 hypothetical protein [Pleionea sp. CnH1-48]
MRIKIILFIVAVSSIHLHASVSGQKKIKPVPSKAAIKACAGQSLGKEVAYINRGGRLISAVCRKADGKLFAVPKSFRKLLPTAKS